jgi:hypothetical protein
MIALVDLYVEEHVLGSDSRFIREAGVCFGRPTVAPVPDDELSALAQRRPDLERWRFTTVALPFDLQDLSGGRRYVETTVRMSFDSPDVRSLALARSPAGEMAEDSDASTWGVGRSELTWKLTARSERLGIRPGGRLVLAVLESPNDRARLTGTLDASAHLSHRMLGVETRSVAESKRPLRFALNVADGAFEVTGDQ